MKKKIPKLFDPLISIFAALCNFLFVLEMQRDSSALPASFPGYSRSPEDSSQFHKASEHKPVQLKLCPSENSLYSTLVSLARLILPRKMDGVRVTSDFSLLFVCFFPKTTLKCPMSQKIPFDTV